MIMVTYWEQPLVHVCSCEPVQSSRSSGSSGGHQGLEWDLQQDSICSSSLSPRQSRRMSSLAAGEECVVETVYKQSAVSPPSTGRMTHQSKTSKDKEEPQRDDNTEVAYKDAGHCSRNTHNLLLGLTVMGRSTQTAGTRGTDRPPPPGWSHPVSHTDLRWF